MKPKECMALPQRPTTLAMHDSSRAIEKLKPKIRIVHVFAPQIIKTDAANFRELVQRLTGKPTVGSGNKTKKKKTVYMTSEGEAGPRCMPVEVVGLWKGIQELGGGEGVKSELEVEEDENEDEDEEKRELWVEKNSDGFCRDFGEIDGFLQELSDVPLLPLCSSQMDVIGEAPSSYQNNWTH